MIKNEDIFFFGGGREGGLERPFLIFWGGSYETPCETRKYVLLIQLQFWREIEAPICLYINASLVVFVAAEGGPNKTCLEISKHLKFKNFKW